MPIYQSFNSRINAWVKYKIGKDGFQVIDVKQREPFKPFKSIHKKGKIQGGKK